VSDDDNDLGSMLDEAMLGVNEAENQAWEMIQKTGPALMRLAQTLPATNADECAIKAAVAFTAGLIAKRQLKEFTRALQEKNRGSTS
jgi:ArsR family metal-binding transcriptional regulator